MNVAEEVYAIVVTLGKSENMRVTASKKFEAIRAFVYSPETSGAQQVIEAGYAPTVAGLWEMITDHPSYPKELGTSLSQGKRLLGIGKASDPEKADQQVRQAQARYASAHRDATERTEPPVTQSISRDTYCNNEASPLDALIAAVKGLSTSDFEEFKAWYCGA